MTHNELPMEQKIDAIIAKLTEGDDFSDEGKLRVEQLRETWREARELIVDQEFRRLMLAEYRRAAIDGVIYSP